MLTTERPRVLQEAHMITLRWAKPLASFTSERGRRDAPGGAILDFRLRIVDFKSKIQNPNSKISREGATGYPLTGVPEKGGR